MVAIYNEKYAVKIKKLLLPTMLCWTSVVFAADVDPLTADIDATDALRFAPLMQDSAVPTAPAGSPAHQRGQV